MNNTIKKSFIAGSVFSLTVLSTYVGYAAIAGVWTDPSTLEASSGSVLTSAKWNALLGSVQQLKDSSAAVGTIASIKAAQTRTQATYSAPASGNGTAIVPLDITITPKKAGNMVILEWVVHGEITYNTVFLASRNGVLLPNATDASNNRWAGITTADYDNDDSSTPNEKLVRIIDFNSLDTASTYQLLVRSAAGTAYTMYLNRTVSSA